MTKIEPWIADALNVKGQPVVDTTIGIFTAFAQRVDRGYLICIRYGNLPNVESEWFFCRDFLEAARDWRAIVEDLRKKTKS